MFHVEGCEGVSNRCPISGSVDCLLTLVFAVGRKKNIRRDILVLLPCRSLTGCFRRKIGEVSAGRRGYSYCQKSYEIYLTPLLRDYCFFGLFSISLPQLPAILRDTAGEKEKCDLSHSLKFRSIPTDFLLNPISTYLRQWCQLFVDYIGN